MSDAELAVLRGMMDEYLYDQARSRFLGTTWKRGRAVILAVAGVCVFAIQCLTLYVTLNPAHHP